MCACHTYHGMGCIKERIKLPVRASLHDPGLNTDPGQFGVEFYVYTSPGWVRAASISLDPGQFLFARLEGLVTTLSVREMADETCNHHQFVFTLSAILPMLFACAQLHGQER